MTIGSRIRAARKARGLSQEEVARRAGMSLNGVALLEQGGRTDPHYSTLVNIARALGVTVAQLIGEAQESPIAEAPTSSPETPNEERRVQDPLAVLDFVTTQVREWGKGQKEYIEEILPNEDMPFEEVIAHLQRVKMFLYWYQLLTWQMNQESFTAAVYPWYERLYRGQRQAELAPVSEDIRQAIIDFGAAWNELETEVVPMTIEWREREKNRHRANNQVAQWSAEMDRLLEQQREEQSRSPIAELIQR